jgi:hypothetical protein
MFLPRGNAVRFIASLAGALLFASASAAWGQAITTGTIEVVVADGQGGLLPGASVSLRNIGQGTIQSQVTDVRGIARFLAVPVATYELRAELQGFNTGVIEKVQVNPGSNQRLSLTLQVGAVSETITVQADAPLINQSSAQESTTLDDEYLEKLPLITRNYTEMPTIFAGVSYNRGARTAYNQFNVRGGPATGNVYQLDGASLNRGVGRAGILVAPSFIDKMEFIPGGFPAEYAGYQSSVINIVSKSGTNDTHGFVSGILKPNALISNIDSGLRSQVRDKPLGSTRFVEASVGGPIRQDSVWYYAGMQYNSEQQGTILSLDPQPRTINVYPAHFKLTYQQNASNRWEVTGHAGPFTDNNSSLSTEVAPESDRKQDIVTWNTVARHSHIFGANGVMETAVQAFFMDFHNNRINDERPPPAESFFVRYFDTALGHFYTRGPSPDRFGVREELRIRAASKYTRVLTTHTFKVGGEYIEVTGGQPRLREVPNFQDLRNRPGSPGAVTRQDPYAVEGSLRDRIVGLFVQDTWAASSRASIDLGVRADWQQQAGYDTTVSPRVGLTLDPFGTGRSKAFANFGIYYSYVFDNVFGFADSRPPEDITWRVANPDANLRGMDVFLSRQRYQVADDLNNPYTVHMSVGYEQVLANNLKGTVAVTKRRGRNQPNNRAITVAPNDVIQLQETSGRLEYQGAEFVLQKAMSNRWEGLISYTLGESEDEAGGILSPVQQAFSFGPADYDQRHTVNITGTAILPADISFTALFRGASGRPYSITNDNPSIFAAFVDRQGNVSGRNQERQPANWTLDFNVARDFAVGGARLRALIQVINATNRVNVIGVSSSFSTAGAPTNIDLSRQIQFGAEIRF